MEFWVQKRKIEHLAILPQILHTFFPKLGKKVGKILNYFGKKHAKTLEKEVYGECGKGRDQGAFSAQCLPSYKLLFSKLVVGKWAPQIKVNEGERGDEGWVTDS